MSKRDVKISADVSEDAKSKLIELCQKAERSRGYMLEQLINDAHKKEFKSTAVAKVVSRFVKPSIQELTAYFLERAKSDGKYICSTEPQKFHDHYESNGWKVGKNKMKCWKSAVRNWMKNVKVQNQNLIESSAAQNWHEEDLGL